MMYIAIIGGDRRMLYAADAFSAHGHTVRCSGFGRLTNSDLPLEKAVGDAQIVVLPVRPTEDDRIFAPFAAEPIGLNQLSASVGSRAVFSGAAQQVSGVFRGKVYDYTAREEFMIQNAVLTAEGAVGWLIQETADALFGARVLVLGYGRIGRILARYLKHLGAYVTVSARRSDARTWAQAEGMNTTDISLREISSFDIIVNTIPALVLPSAQLDRMRTDTLIMDLASAPSGVDVKRAGERGITLIHALALPGKTAPKAAGRIIQSTISHIIKEENGEEDNPGLCDDRLFLHL